MARRTMVRKKQHRALKRKNSKKERENRATLILPMGLMIILLFAIIFFNQNGLVGTAVYVSEADPKGEINLTKEGSVTFTSLPSTSKQIVISTGISAADDTPKSYSFNLSNKGSQLYGYELKYQDIVLARDTLYTGSSQDISLVYLNLNDTVPDLRVWYAAGKVTVQNLHTTTPVVCGNGLVEGPEQCDGSNLLGKSCQGLGFPSGTLSCASCTFNTNACTGAVPVTPKEPEEQVQPVEQPEEQVQPPVPPDTTSVVNGTKVSLGEIAPADSTFSTLITATEDFSKDLVVYTVLYDEEGRVLVLESDEITDGMLKGEFYAITAKYDPASKVKKKAVLVFDKELNPKVYGKLEETYS